MRTMTNSCCAAAVVGSLEPGAMLYFPVVQECATKTERWIEIPAAGQDPESLEGPAPGVRLLPASGDHD